MNDQEQELRRQDGGFDFDTLNLLSTLHLNSAAASNTTTTTLPATHSPFVFSAHKHSSRKRRSPSSSSSRRKKIRAKRTALFPSPTATSPAAATSPLFSAISPNPPPPSPLQRSFSEPIRVSDSTQAADTPKTQLFSSLAAASAQLLNNLSPENSKNNGFFAKSPSPAADPSLPPLPPPLRRSSSDPIPSNHLPSATTTPPRHPAAARTFSRSPSCDQESPNSMRLKRIKEKMQEMSEWCQEVVREEDEETDSEDDYRKNNNDEFEKESGEAVSVDEMNGGSVIHFKCPCGKGYEVLLSGNTCYYKLM